MKARRWNDRGCHLFRDRAELQRVKRDLARGRRERAARKLAANVFDDDYPWDKHEGPELRDQ